MLTCSDLVCLTNETVDVPTTTTVPSQKHTNLNRYFSYNNNIINKRNVKGKKKKNKSIESSMNDLVLSLLISW